ncbi:MAG: carboxylating nicotinate-nucleotide diphosphorylase [Candidatus Odinarchaeia archaeon]
MTDIKRKILSELWEDIGFGDITSEFTLKSKNALGVITAEEEGILAGAWEAQVIFQELNLHVSPQLKDGERITAGAKILEVKGAATKILLGERAALNFLMRMSGIATATFNALKIAREVNPHIRIAATRKTAPLLRYFDKKAVEIGGGDPHRFRLDDCVLIKDNHLALVGSIKEAVKQAREKISFTKKIEVEVETLNDAIEAAKAGADIIMLDNMSPVEIIKTIEELKKQKLRDNVLIEASGGITLNNIKQYAATGVDIISMGSITHSVKALNFKMEITPI